MAPSDPNDPTNPFDHLPHLDHRGFARMVDVGTKPSTHRVAVAEAFIRMKPDTLRLLRDGSLYKGDAMSVARIAGIAGSKRTADLIPLAHPVALTHAAVDVALEPRNDGVRIETRVETRAQTGVELEALVAATTAALAIYDMAKSHDRGMVIEGVQLKLKSGGRSGTYSREEPSGETELDDRSKRAAGTERKAAVKRKAAKTAAAKKTAAKRTVAKKARAKKSAPKKAPAKKAKSRK